MYLHALRFANRTIEQSVLSSSTPRLSFAFITRGIPLCTRCSDRLFIFRDRCPFRDGSCKITDLGSSPRQRWDLWELLFTNRNRCNLLKEWELSIWSRTVCLIVWILVSSFMVCSSFRKAFLWVHKIRLLRILYFCIFSFMCSVKV